MLDNLRRYGIGDKGGIYPSVDAALGCLREVSAVAAAAKPRLSVGDGSTRPPMILIKNEARKMSRSVRSALWSSNERPKRRVTEPGQTSRQGGLTWQAMLLTMPFLQPGP